MKDLYIPFIAVLFTYSAFAQNPNFYIDSNNKYVEFKKTIISDDFYNAAQIKVGTYLTLGNYGNTNNSWIGSNAILDYSSYGGRGSLGDKNLFIPAWNQGTALVITPDFVGGNFTGYTHSWNSSSNQVDIKDFNTTWNLGPEKSFVNSKLGVGTTNPTQKFQIDANDTAIQVQLNRTGTNSGKVDFGVDGDGLHYWVGGYDGFGKEEFFVGSNGNIGVG
ncbi:MAG: hypothetical protein CL613_05835 [Aquimarina sp.]|nr:hypothetical protein [Aquimarina sp.]